MRNDQFSPYLVGLTVAIIIGLSISYSQESAPSSESSRTWTNTQGESIEGKLMSVEGEKVRLLVNGKEFVVPLSGLSSEDNAFVEEWQARVSVALTQKLSVIRSEGVFQVLDENGKVLGSVSEGEWFDSGMPLPTDENPSSEKPRIASASQSQQIFSGQSIRTNPDSRVALYSTSGAVIQVQEDTELHIPERTEEGPKNSLELLKGSLFLNVDAKQLQSERKEFRLKTPAAILTVKGTQFFAEARTDDTIAGVYEGRVEGITEAEQREDITAGLVAEFYENRTQTREMSEKEREDRKVFDTLTVQKSSLADRKWGWNSFDWEVHTLLAKDGPEGKPELRSTNIQRGQNQAGNLFVQFRPISDDSQYGEFRIDTMVSELGEDLLGAEFRVRANREVPLIVTTIGADAKEAERKKGGLLDRRGYEYLAQFHNLTTIQEHKIQNWGSYRQGDDTVLLPNGEWTTHFVPFNRSDYPESYEVESWYIFLCFGPEVVAERKLVEIEVAPPILIFDQPIEP